MTLLSGRCHKAATVWATKALAGGLIHVKEFFEVVKPKNEGTGLIELYMLTLG